MSETPSTENHTPSGLDEFVNESREEGEFQDPAIVCQRRGGVETSFPKEGEPKFRYSHAELKALRDKPLCKIIPECYDSRLFIWRRFGRTGEEESSTQSTGTSSSRDRGEPRERRIYDNGSNTSRGEMKRGGTDKDPRERLKKEDNIILSPQRRSFNMGCQMPAPPPSTNTTPALGSSLLRNDRDIINGGRDRRIGSGRILARDVSWDYRPDKNDPDQETSFTNYRAGNTNNGSSNNSAGTVSSNNFRDEKPTYESRRSNNYNSERSNRDYESSGREKESSFPNTRQYGDRNSRYSNNSRSYNHRNRSYSDGKDEEPEWFSAGPTSQLETIDLHGFDGPICEEKETSNKDKQQLDEKNAIKIRNEHEKSNRKKTEDENSKSSSRTNEMRSESNNNLKYNDTNNNKDNEIEKVPKDEESQKQLLEVLRNDGDDFNFEEFLNLDSITGLLSSQNQEIQQSRETIVGASRFSQWFSRDSPTKNLGGKKSLFDSRRSSLHDELNNLIGDMSNEMKGSDQQTTNPESNKYFAPISPAANTPNSRVGLLDIIQRSNGSQSSVAAGMKDGMHHPVDNRNLMFVMEQQKLSGMNSPSMSQMPSVEELEARLRGHIGNEHSPVQSNGVRIIQPTGTAMSSKTNIPVVNPETNVPINTMQDPNAFKRLLAQMSDGIQGAQSMNPNLQQIQHQQQMNLIQMLSQQTKQGPNPPNADDLKKMFNFMQQMHGANNPIPQGRPIQGQKQSLNPSGKDPIGNILHQMPPLQHNLQPDHRNTEILKRPEAQLLIQSIIRGDMKPAMLWQQMSNPTTTPRQRETLTAVLNTFNSSPRVSSPNLLIPPPGGAPIPPLVQNGALTADLQAQILIQQQKQQMRVSPLPNGMPQRIPSPRELQYHTQSIMQNALIRKKLEEQRENFRKRQEAQAQQNQHNPATTASTTANNIQTTNVVTSTSATSQQTNSQTAGVNSSPAKHTNSPTPLAFTPTSVLRKMTADKGPEENSATLSSIVSSSSASSALLNSIASTGANKIGAPNSIQRMSQNAAAPQLNAQTANLQIGQPIRGGVQQRPGPLNMPQPQQNIPGSITHQHLPTGTNMTWLQQQLQVQATNNQIPKPPVGRPIVKQQNNPPSVQTNPVANPQIIQYNQAPNFDFTAAMQQHQQQQRKIQEAVNPTVNSTNNLAVTSGGNPALTAHQIQQLMAHRQQVQAAQVQQQQQKYLELQRYRQLMDQQRHSSASTIPGENSHGASDRHLMNFGRDGNLSPTSNQLARWFSPELLAQASAGKLPSINSTQALSLEEFERSMQNSSATVLN
uniref:CSON003341 protein n=1 Tax=Culicoides sonorensis TaxID=179676 RepID=A0A336LMY6_CULSO